MIGGKDSQRDSQAERQQYSHQSHLRGHLPAFCNQSGHGGGRLLVRDAEIEVQDYMLHVVKVLDVDRFVERTCAGYLLWQPAAGDPWFRQRGRRALGA